MVLYQIRFLHSVSLIGTYMYRINSGCIINMPITFACYVLLHQLPHRYNFIIIVLIGISNVDKSTLFLNPLRRRHRNAMYILIFQIPSSKIKVKIPRKSRNSEKMSQFREKCRDWKYVYINVLVKRRVVSR